MSDFLTEVEAWIERNGHGASLVLAEHLEVDRSAVAHWLKRLRDGGGIRPATERALREAMTSSTVGATTRRRIQHAMDLCPPDARPAVVEWFRTTFEAAE